MDDILSGFGSALSSLGQYTKQTVEATSSSVQGAQLGQKVGSFWGGVTNAVQDPNAGANLSNATSSLWGRLATTVGDVAKIITEPDAAEGGSTPGGGGGGGLDDLRAMAQKEAAAKPSKYAGFGSDSRGSNGGGRAGSSGSLGAQKFGGGIGGGGGVRQRRDRWSIDIFRGGCWWQSQQHRGQRTRG